MRGDGGSVNTVTYKGQTHSGKLSAMTAKWHFQHAYVTMLNFSFSRFKKINLSLTSGNIIVFYLI